MVCMHDMLAEDVVVKPAPIFKLSYPRLAHRAHRSRAMARAVSTGGGGEEESGLDRPSNFDGCTPARYKMSPGLRPGKILRILAVAGAPPARVCRLPG